MSWWRILIGVACVVSVAAPGFAQEAPEKAKDPYELPELAITAEKTPQPVQEVTQRHDILTKEQIEQIPLGQRNLAEIFKYQPSTFVNPLSRNDANWGSYGGLGPRYNVYLLDGLPIDSFVDPMSLDAIYLERAEIQRGPASIMYSNYLSMDFAGNQTALAGISNLITKERIDAPQTRIIGGYGKWNTFLGKLYHQGNAGNFHYFLGTTYEQSDYTNYGTPDSWLNMIDKPEYRKIKAYAKATYFFTPETRLSLFGHHTMHDGDAGRPNRGFDHQYDLLNLAFESRLTPALTLGAKAGYRYYNRTWEEDHFPTSLALRSTDGVRQHIFPLDVALSWRHWDRSLLTFGTDHQFLTYKTFSEVAGLRSYFNDVDARLHGVYLEEKLVLGNWVLRAGVRYAHTHHDYDRVSGVVPAQRSRSWDRVLWSAGLRYNVSPRFALFANAGSSYVVPSAKSVAGTIPASDFGVPGRHGQLPNPGLSPESGISTDFGAVAWVLPNLRVGIRGFYTRVDDVIVENVVSRDPSQTQSVNAGKVDAGGFEIDLIHPWHKSFYWFANATYTQTNVTNSLDPRQNNSDVPFVPKWMANVGFTAHLPYDFTISPYFQYIGHYFDTTDKTFRRRFGSYVTVNAKATKSLYKASRFEWLANLEIVNLFNRRYEMPWQFRDVGFQALGSLELRF